MTGDDSNATESFPAAYVDALRRDADHRVMMAELKSRALSAGMVDADGLKLLDLSKVGLAEDGSLTMPDGFFESARKSRPYLFSGGMPANAAGSVARAPAQSPPPVRLATEMSFEEWQAARADLLRRG
jgi:hypothetical protein